MNDKLACDELSTTLAVDGESRMYVIDAIRKGGHIGAYKPNASRAVYNLMCPYDAMPHDARHTLVTNLLEKNVPLHTTQKIARHKRGETTMGYAHAMEAGQLARTVPHPVWISCRFSHVLVSQCR